MFAHHASDVIVEKPRQVVSVLRLGPVTAHHRHSGKHLHGDTVPVAILQTTARVPAVVFDLAEEFAVDHHAGAAGTDVFHLHEAARAVAFTQVRPVAWQDVRVQIDLHYTL